MRKRRYGRRSYGSYRGGHYVGRRNRMLKVLLVLLGAALICFGALEIVIAVHSATSIAGEPEVMVIFGCQVKPWGPSVLLQDRLDTALDYLEDHPDLRVVVAGGKGDDEHMSEAQCMYDYLTARGVDGGNIFMEDRSRNTWENVNETLALMQREGWDATDDVVLVSNGFHLARIRMLWDRARTGLLQDEVYNGQYVSTLAAPSSHLPTAVMMLFREPLALVKSFLFDR